MLRRLLVVAFVAAAAAACGSGTPTASPAASPTNAQTAAPATAPTEAPTAAPPAAGPTTMNAACNAVGLRKLPSSKGALIVRLGAGTEVRVIETLPGDSYAAGACGNAGDTWLKIDQVDGKAVQALYGVPATYAAAGFFK